MALPEYTISLLIWIVPILAFSVFFVSKRLLTPEKSFALFITVIVLGSIGILLDLCFGNLFFVFPNQQAVLGITVRKIPIEEFVFYITGFWFVVYVYVFCDEYFLKKYNPPDEKYARFRAKLKRRIFLHRRSVWTAFLLLAGGTMVKRILNPSGEPVPGYFFFLTLVAYVPAILFYRVTKSFINWRALIFSMLLTVLISIIWEVTLAIPRGYWGYQNGAMLGIFAGAWHDLPIEAVSVWIVSTLAILCYEFIKIVYFTPLPSVPGHKLWLKMGREWRT